MGHLVHRASASLSGSLRRLDRRLRIDHRGRSEWIWVVPFLTLLGTLALVLVAGAMSHASVALVVPVAVVVALVVAGQSVAYMNPEQDAADDGDDDDRRPAVPGAPPDEALEQVVPAWYRQLADRTADEPRPEPRRRPRAPARRS